MNSKIVLLLFALGSIQALPNNYLNSFPSSLQNSQNQQLQLFPSNFYYDNLNNFKQNQYSEPAKQFFLNHVPVQQIFQQPQQQIQVQPFRPSVFFQPSVMPIIRPFQIQQPTIATSGQVIVENLLGGIPFNCLGKPSGHFRDNNLCDVFHACVHGYQRKTYSCPFVGESQYFDEATQRCEFVKNNPSGCASKTFLH